MCKFCCISLGIALITIFSLIYRFQFDDQNLNPEDGRQPIQLLPTESRHVLSEMRIFLETVQQIIQGITEKDMNAVKEAAHRAAVANQADTPETLSRKLPLEFKKLGLNTHKKFAILALDAEQLEDPDHALEQLVDLMNNCTSCHASYRLN